MYSRIFTLLIAQIALIASAANLSANADKQSFGGFGLGFEIFNHDGSGAGIYGQAQGGYNFNSSIGIGLYAGIAKAGTVNIRTIDFGTFLQLTDGDSGFYGKLMLGGMHAKTDSGGTFHGVKGSEAGFAPGIAFGLLIPSAGDFHMVPELGYKMGFFDSQVNIIQASFNLIWDF